MSLSKQFACTCNMILKISLKHLTAYLASSLFCIFSHTLKIIIRSILFSGLSRLPQSQSKSIMVTIVFWKILKGPIISLIFLLHYVYMIYGSAINMRRLGHYLLESHLFQACCHIVLTLCHST